MSFVTFGFQALINEIGSPSAYIVKKAIAEIPNATGITWSSLLTRYLNIKLPARALNLLAKLAVSLFTLSLSRIYVLSLFEF